MNTHRQDAGFSLAALIFFLTAASIFIAAAVPSYQMQAKREVEEELIFRGEEYTRAIQKYQRRFGVYPSSIDQLVSTNGLRFVRRAYKDPINGKDFRLISINPDGSVTGSKAFQQNINNQPMFGNTQPFGQGQTPNQQPGSQQQQQRGFQPSGQQQGGQGLGQGQQQQQQRGSFGGAGITTPTSITGMQNPAQQRGSQAAGGSSAITPFGNSNGGAGNGTPVASGGIIGVASDVSQDSVKVYNNRQKYDEWEFIAILGQQGQQGQPGQQQQNPNQQNPNQQQNPQGRGQNDPFRTPPNSPFGGQPAGSPFGTGGGQRQIQSPFGFGGTNPTNPTNQPRKSQ